MEPAGGHDVAPDPILLFRRWRDEAQARTGTADAMVLATATPDGRPSARAVILRTFDASGFVFCTDTGSRKAEELAANPRAVLVFLWPEVQHQVRVEGEVAALSGEEGDTLFGPRPREFKLSVWASRQDHPVADRGELERHLEEAAARFPADVPRPPWWGSYRLVPSVLEFWTGRTAIHDRVEYVRGGPGEGWSHRRLSP